MTLAGAEGWYFICERLCAEHSNPFFTYQPPVSAASGIAWDGLDVHMADTPLVWMPPVGTKRNRDDDGDEDVFEYELRLGKKYRPMSGDSSTWAQDSVLNTPNSTTNMDPRALQKPKYDSDDLSSMMSEPGSPQDIAMSSGDEDMEDDTHALSHSPDERFGGKLPSSSWQPRTQTNRVPTPSLPHTRPGVRSMGVRVGIKQHIRARHPQESNSSTFSDHLEVPSPIDEDEVPTPPSAAEAAGSQLSMLTVNDMDMETSRPDLPTISIDPSQTLPFDEDVQQSLEAESAIDDLEPLNSALGPDPGLFVRKQRARSGALSSGHGSPAPVLGDLGTKRGLSMGFRADCEKCRLRVPGHMNHFIS